MPSPKTVVMVPQGAEFKAVQRGFKSALKHNQATKMIELVSLPVGPEPVRIFLAQWCREWEAKRKTQPFRVILMGLCGSLSPALKVKDVVLYKQCMNLSQRGDVLPCSTNLPLASIKEKVAGVTSVTGIMCDRVLAKAEEKRHLGQQCGAQVVDMEGFATLQVLRQRVKEISMMRVVSDDAKYDLPDLDEAFDTNGKIRPGIMMRQFLMEPLGAMRLIKGSLSALGELEKLACGLATDIYSENDISKRSTETI